MKLFQQLLVAGASLSLIAPTTAQASDVVNIEEMNSYARSEKKLTYPALDFVLKCSHTFNLLDSRGVISVTDRAQYIEKIRKLAKDVASTWIEEREFLKFPLIK